MFCSEIKLAADGSDPNPHRLRMPRTIIMGCPALFFARLHKTSNYTHLLPSLGRAQSQAVRQNPPVSGSTKNPPMSTSAFIN